MRLSPLGTAATVWPILPAPDDDDDDNCGAIGRIRIGRGTEVFVGNPPQCHFVHHKSHMTWHGLEPGPPRREAVD
jgi:hypothetical protein